MDFQKSRKIDPRDQPPSVLPMVEPFIKIVAFVVLLVVGLKLAFWAVGIVDELIHQPEQIALIRPLLEGSPDTVRSIEIEDTGDGILIQDRNALTLFMIVGLIAVLFSAIGRIIAALIGGSIKLLTSIDFGRGRPPAAPPKC